MYMTLLSSAFVCGWITGVSFGTSDDDCIDGSETIGVEVDVSCGLLWSLADVDTLSFTTVISSNRD